MQERFFVDERSGIVAVRDRMYTDPDYNGLHSDTNGVIKSWGGVYNRKSYCWNLEQWQVDEANNLCRELNNGADYTPDVDWQPYYCEKWHLIEYDYYAMTAKCPCGITGF